MKRFVGVVLVVAALVGSTPSAPVAAITTPSAVEWGLPHHPSKTITVKVRLLLYPVCHEQGLFGGELVEWRRGLPWAASRCPVTQATADAIRDAILQVWKGQVFRCYTLIFDIDIQIDNNSSRFTVEPSDRIAVRVGAMPTDFRSGVATTGRRGPRAWESEAPEGRLTPVNDRNTPSTWSYPTSAGTEGWGYAHEFGHILGLHDSYDEATGLPYANAPDDVMASQGNAHIDQRTINRLAKRAGIVSEDLKCDYKIDYTEAGGWLRFHGFKCETSTGDSSIGEWKIYADGVFPGAGFTLVGDGLFTAQIGPPPLVNANTFDARIRTDVQGIPVTTGGQAGTMSGSAAFDPGALTLTLTRQNYTGTVWARTPPKSINEIPLDPPLAIIFPVENGRYIECASTRPS